MARLFKVRCEFDFIVRAEDEDDAFLVARRTWDDAARDEGDPDLFVGDEITTPAQIPRDWRGCFPYRMRNTPEERLEEVLAAQGKSEGL